MTPRLPFLLFLVTSPLAFAQSLQDDMTAVLPTVVVEGKAENLLGIALSASQGQSSQEELAARPFLRRGELLEVVPGMIVTQHSGGGKANQYFVRGYNLDHGTDFAMFVEGMPINARSHGHGQGYADINFLIPEMIEQLDYRKGPFGAEYGDFSTAGAARFRLKKFLERGMASVGWGENEYYRALVADSFKVGEGTLTAALEFQHYNGPWVNPDGLERWNGMLQYHMGDDDTFATITFLGSDATWDGTDQIPERAIRSGAIDRFGYVDPSSGGETSRYTLMGTFQKTEGDQVTKGSVYAGFYDLDLYSNFTYFLDDPVNGDQFNQVDERWYAGGEISYTWKKQDFLGVDSDFTVGLQTHHDWINDVGLHKTRNRQRLSTVRSDDIYETNLSGFAAAEMRITDWFRLSPGVRADLYYFDVNSDLPANSGNEWDGIISPKLSFALGPWNETEFYGNIGMGFHSNDARGVTITRDPVAGTALNGVDPLVRTWGAEVGMRTHIVPDLTTTLSLWYLHSDSELVYVGDAGNIEAGDASDRYGIEWAAYWKPIEGLLVDSEVSWSEAEFTDGSYIENYVPLSISGGITFGRETGAFASLRGRFFSPRPLNGDGSVESDTAFQLNARAGWRGENWEIALEALNLLDSDDNDIEYLYDSRLAGEPAGGFEDRHVHPFEPRQFRVSFTIYW